MPRNPAIQQSEFPYNISARCINREWFALPMPEVWTIFCEELAGVVEEFELQIHAFVLMSNHYHMLATTPRSNISACMQQLQFRISRRLTQQGNRINGTFAGRHYKSIITTTVGFHHAYKYLYRNPVGAGLSLRPEDYAFSTLKFLVDGKQTPFPLAKDSVFQADPIGTLAWLNVAPEPEKLKAVKIGLRRTFFKSSRSNTTKRLILSEHEVI